MANTSKSDFGFDQITNKTPEWAKWIFRGWLIISNALTGFIATLAAIKGINITPVEVGVIMATINFLNLIVYGFSKLFGIVTEQAEAGHPVIATQQVQDNGTDVKDINPVVVQTTEAPVLDPDKINTVGFDASKQSVGRPMTAVVTQ